MVFSSTVFIFLFLPIVLGLSIAAPRRYRNFFLLCSSLFFYAWGETWFTLVMIASILIDYLCGLAISGGWKIDKTQEIPLVPKDKKRTLGQKLALLLSLTGNLSILAFFKYFNFGLDNYNTLVETLGLSGFRIDTTLQVLLPIGISFFTFQSMSYTIDVYLGNARATRNLINFSTFVSLFPQLVAGPIVRYRDISKELVERTITREDFSTGVRRFIVGLGKKLLIANAVAYPADQIFALSGDQLTSSLAWLGVTCYTLQIYFDFSGYSDMAIGLGRMFGFHFLENFNYPYISKSMTEFWRRWHISLSTWFRDYLYIPLGGNRRSRVRLYINLFLVFFLCGLWHGASWNFIAWGLYHGIFLVLERVVSKRMNFKNPFLWNPLRHFYVILVTLISWVLFRAETLPEAMIFLKTMFGFGQGIAKVYYLGLYLNQELILVLIIGIIGSAPWIPKIQQWYQNYRVSHKGLSLSILDFLYCYGEIILLAILFLLSAMDLSATTHNPFIYFRF